MLVLACTPPRRANEKFCDVGVPCKAGLCQLQTHTCVVSVDGAGGDAGVPLDTRVDDSSDTGAQAADALDDQAAAIVDAPFDALVDTRDAVPVDDGPRSCGTCPATTPICDTATGLCGPCTGDPACAALSTSARYCEGGRCVGCRTKADCPSPLPLCDSTSRVCKGCATNAECAANSSERAFCNAGPCVECLDHAACPTAKPICDAVMHTCGVCTTGEQCAKRNAATPACSGGTCVECNSDAECGNAKKPICLAHVCVACSSDKQCEKKLGANPGVCMFHTDGHCATDSEVSYVVPALGCDDSTSGTGSLTKPFCTPQRAMMAVSPTKNVVVIRPGTSAVERWSYSRVAGVSELTVIGQKGATISGGAGVGITINSGSVYLRGITVSMMLDLGIHVPPGDTNLRMDRCVFTKNKGGMMIDGAGFEISNSVFAENYNNDVAVPGTSFGGAYLGGVATKMKVFRNNTIYKNEGPGVICGGPYPVKGLLVANNTGSQINVCDISDPSTITSGNTVLNVQFDPNNPYHLTATSPCVDKGSATDFPFDDLDGNVRPSGPQSDCGAHELQR